MDAGPPWRASRKPSGFPLLRALSTELTRSIEQVKRRSISDRAPMYPFEDRGRRGQANTIGYDRTITL